MINSYNYFNNLSTNKINNLFVHILESYALVVSTNQSAEIWNRYDGPCYFARSGVKSRWINDCDVTPLIKDWAKENEIDLDNLSKDDVNLIKLVWSDFSY